MTTNPRTPLEFSGLPSRRAMIAALAAAPVAGLPALASARGAIDDPDRIFALLDACGQAKRNADEASKIHDRAETLAVSPVMVDVTVCGEKYEAHGRKSLEEWLDARRPSHCVAEWADIAKRLNMKSRRRGSSPEDEARYEVERGVAMAKFDEASRHYDAKKEASGLDDAERRMNELNNIFWDAEKAVLACEPSGPAGAIALLMFAAEYLADGLSPNPRKSRPCW